MIEIVRKYLIGKKVKIPKYKLPCKHMTKRVYKSEVEREMDRGSLRSKGLIESKGRAR